jgi:hypothetical protein
MTTQQNALVSIALAVVIFVAFTVSLNPVIAKVNAFAFIQACLCLSLGGSSFYFMTDDEDQFPGGPNFGTTFYAIVLPFCGNLFSLVGIWAYKRTSTTWTYQQMYIFGNLLSTFAYLLDTVFYLQLHRSWCFGQYCGKEYAHVLDHAFVLGGTSLQNVIGWWLWMPSIVLMSQLCPTGMEAIMFANIAGCHNLGSTIAKNLGAVLLEEASVRPNGSPNEGSQFQNLWMVSMISSLLPLVPIVLVPWFIPNKLNTEPVFEDDDFDANTGSLLQRWGVDTS